MSPVASHQAWIRQLRDLAMFGRPRMLCGFKPAKHPNAGERRHRASQRAGAGAARPVPAGLYRIKLDATRRYPNSSPGHTYRRVRISPAKAVP